MLRVRGLTKRYGPLLAAAILAAWAATGRIYEQVLLRRGTRISWRDAASLIRRT